ncbi:small ubiquitin-related modifier-like [Adelges cooleyi]|uniref:small ubiquitin-related modifier-like n=1 Tax=Adelges cooleyi TaxID=133065 RepID=UPI00217F962A|nr:small ubiquitin-related modifier-like [Adelges cooleyi]
MDNPDRLFLLSLINDFQQVPEDKKMDVKLSIMQIISNAKQSPRQNNSQNLTQNHQEDDQHQRFQTPTSTPNENIPIHSLDASQSRSSSSGAPECIILKVLGQDNAVVQFRINKDSTFRRLMSTYCERTGFVMATVRFRFDGQRISEDDTPLSLEMEEGHTIDVYQEQFG